VRPEQIRTVDDLRRLPLSQKRDLLPTADDPQRSSKFILQPDARVRSESRVAAAEEAAAAVDQSGRRAPPR
jgi:hypothetical protein